VVLADPRGGEPASNSIEDGLRNLVQFGGPSVRELSDGVKAGYKAILDAAHVPDDWTVDANGSGRPGCRGFHCSGLAGRAIRRSRREVRTMGHDD
jgi:hypothetical protein